MKSAWLIMCLSVAGCAQKASNREREAEQPRTESATSSVEGAISAIKDLAKSGAEVKAQLAPLFHDLAQTLDSVKDSETAKRALADLQEGDQKLGELLRLVEQKVPASARPAIAIAAKKGSDKLKELIVRVEKTEGVNDSIKQVLNGILEKLDALEKPK